jgi:uncharacterized protein
MGMIDLYRRLNKHAFGVKYYKYHVSIRLPPYLVLISTSSLLQFLSSPPSLPRPHPIQPTMASLAPPFTRATALQKVKFAQNNWNSCNPVQVSKGYTKNCIWRNRDQFVKGTDEIVRFLTKKWEKEKNYRLRKELFCWSEVGLAFLRCDRWEQLAGLGVDVKQDRIAVQFFYEYQDSHDNMKWKRCYGLEDWFFESEGPEKGKMKKRMMSGNDIELGKDGDGVGMNSAEWKREKVGEMGDKGWVEGRWFVGEHEGGICSAEEVEEDKITKLMNDRHL